MFPVPRSLLFLREPSSLPERPGDVRTTRLLLIAAASVLAAGCGLFDGGNAGLPEGAPAPGELLRLSDEAMRALRSLRAGTRGGPSGPGNPPSESAVELRGTRCVRDGRSGRQPGPSGRR